MIYIRKHREGDCEYISASDVFKFLPEATEKAQSMFNFLYLVEHQLNYFNMNNSTAFGNPDYEFISGQVVGYCKAKGWIWEEKDGIISIRSGSRTFMKIEKPGIPSWEKEKRADIRKMYDDLGI